MKALVLKARNAVCSKRGQAILTSLLLMFAFVGAAVAGGGGGVDTSEITAQITSNKDKAIVLVIAMLVAGWAITTLFLLRPRK